MPSRWCIFSEKVPWSIQWKSAGSPSFPFFFLLTIIPFGWQGTFLSVSVLPASPYEDWTPRRWNQGSQTLSLMAHLETPCEPYSCGLMTHRTFPSFAKYRSPIQFPTPVNCWWTAVPLRRVLTGRVDDLSVGVPAMLTQQGEVSCMVAMGDYCPKACAGLVWGVWAVTVVRFLFDWGLGSCIKASGVSDTPRWDGHRCCVLRLSTRSKLCTWECVHTIYPPGFIFQTPKE